MSAEEEIVVIHGKDFELPLRLGGSIRLHPGDMLVLNVEWPSVFLDDEEVTRIRDYLTRYLEASKVYMKAWEAQRAQKAGTS